MFNRFKNAIYGSSAASEDIATARIRIEYEYNETILPRRIRSTLFRSPSFRDDLLRGSDSGKSQTPARANQDDVDLGKNRTHHQQCLQQNSQSMRRATTSDRLADTNKQQLYEHYNNNNQTNSSRTNKFHKFRYTRPDFLQLKTEDEILVSADHQIRPIILPRDVYSLPWRSGYAECINAGKSLRNEDQAVFYQDIAVKRVSTIEEMDESSNQLDSIPMESQLPWVYFGIFDGHAGSAVAVAAAAQLHNIIGEKLRQVADLLIALEFELGNTEDDDDDDTDEFADCEPATEEPTTDAANSKKEESEKPAAAAETEPPKADLVDHGGVEPTTKGEAEAANGEKLTTRQSSESPVVVSPERGLPKMIDICKNNITVDSLVTGALESAFWEMDALIAEDKCEYKMPGGCTALVSLFILGKLYTCNAGDSRAIVVRSGGEGNNTKKSHKVIPMSFDFTPTSERERILRLGQQRPEFMGTDFTHLEFIKRPTRKDLGKQMLYKDAYMTGWSMKTITYDDLKFPLVWGEGKRSRVLATIGVTRGFGDHELKAQYGSVHIKPFLTPEPEVRILALDETSSAPLTAEDVLIMGSDGLWDVTTNEEAAQIVRHSFELFSDNEETRSKYRYITAAQDLVIYSRGHTNNWNQAWKTGDGRFASLDDICVFVIPLKQYRDEYAEWKRLRSQARSARSSSHRRRTAAKVQQQPAPTPTSESDEQKSQAEVGTGEPAPTSDKLQQGEEEAIE